MTLTGKHGRIKHKICRIEVAAYISKRGKGTGSRFSHAERGGRRRAPPPEEAGSGRMVNSHATVISGTDGALSAFVNILPVEQFALSRHYSTKSAA